MHFIDGVSIREIRRRTGLHRETIRRALAAKRPPAYRRAKAPSKLDPFKEEIERLLRSEHLASSASARWARRRSSAFSVSSGSAPLRPRLRPSSPTRSIHALGVQ